MHALVRNAGNDDSYFNNWNAKNRSIIQTFPLSGVIIDCVDIGIGGYINCDCSGWQSSNCLLNSSRVLFVFARFSSNLYRIHSFSILRWREYGNTHVQSESMWNRSKTSLRTHATVFRLRLSPEWYHSSMPYWHHILPCCSLSGVAGERDFGQNLFADLDSFSLSQSFALFLCLCALALPAKAFLCDCGDTPSSNCSCFCDDPR
jgi:hypothetical protein